MTSRNFDFENIRQWGGSQHQAFEELCYQLRDPTPQGAELVKTGNPDGGLEWYVTFGNGTQWGWQAKFSFDIDSLLNGMEKSLKTVVEKRPNCRRLTFCIPFDLPDAVEAGKRKSARQRYEDRKKSWRQRIPGADRIRIELWSEGDLLQRLVGHPRQRGIAWFFWNREVFSPEWCTQRMGILRDTVGRRYRPELHVEVPVSFALEGLALSENYWMRFRGLREDVIKAADRVQVSRYTGLGVTKELRHLKRKLLEWQCAMPAKTSLPDRLQRDALLSLTRECMKIVQDSSPPAPPRQQRKRTEKQRIREERVRSLIRHLMSLGYSLDQVEQLLLSDASKAAASGALLLRGSAGQGKTHLFCDVAARALEAGQPAVVILGGSLSGHNVWSEIGEQLGLAGVGSEEVVSAMQAAAEASNTPFLLLLDALNEAADPRAWRTELPRLLAEVAQNRWISVAVSVRSAFLPMMLPEDRISNIAEVEHPGFDGRELEATERIFDCFELEQPRIPLLTPEFTNPLFLILYCESLEGMGLTAPPLGGAHLSETFQRYLDRKEQRIVHHLGMDPALRPAQTAIGSFCRALVEANSDALPYEVASDLIDKVGNSTQQWPNTLFGQLLSEDVLSKDMARDAQTNEARQVVRFTYQQLADYQVVSRLLEPFGGDAESLRQGLSPGEPLRQTILDAPPNWIEALTVMVAERFGVEMQDIVEWDLDGFNRYLWDYALVTSVALRRPSTVTERTLELLAEAQDRRPDLRDSVLETWLSVATQPEHLLNANRLHDALKDMTMPDRDVAWSIPTYHTLDNGGPLDRLIRWASRSRRPDCPREVVELAAVVLAWTFTSPNRRLRDQATKALAQLLSEHLSVLPALIPRFAGLNDPYVIERLAVACQGAVLSGSPWEPQAVVDAADGLKRVVFADDQSPHAITRDAVRGIYGWCFRNGWVDRNDYTEVLPPYSATPPEEPPTEEEIRRDYDIRSQDHQPGPRPFGQLLRSVFSMGDFGRYIIGSAMHHFTPYLLDQPVPKEDQHTIFDSAWAQRWVFKRVVSLGWTPERFADFDQGVNYWSASRTNHKPERFGKKYQWIAFHELIARVADNFYIRPVYGGEPEAYEGPWQFLGRDIDPTLPPPIQTRNADDEVEVGPTFSEDTSLWWVPDGPRYRDDDQPAGGGWGTENHDIPEFKPLVQRKDSDGNRWVVLHAGYTWVDELGSSMMSRTRPREFWSHIYSWLVRPEQRDSLVAYLERRSLMGNWMPQPVHHTNADYLGELPSTASLEDTDNSWEPIRAGNNWTPTGLEVMPAWEEYLWEGQGLDCSLEDGVSAWLPARILFQAGCLAWKPGTREWCDPAGVPVAQFVEARRQSVLLVREDWLRQTLRKVNLAIVFGWLGEKRLYESGGLFSDVAIVGNWTEMNAVASFHGQRWAFGQRRLETRAVG